MGDNDGCGWAALWFLLGMFACVFLIAWYSPRGHFEKEAIQHGHARWFVDDEGERQFQWIDVAPSGEKGAER